MFSEKFICASKEMGDYDHHVPAPLFRKVFTVEQMPACATFSICGLGFYELYINGQRITKGALAPYIQNPDDILYYDAYDVLPYLQQGENVIGIMLGNGFFNCIGGWMWDFEKAPWRGPLRVAFSLEMDGGLPFEADESVKTADSAVLFDDLRIGAFYDARLEQPGWHSPGFDDTAWTPAMPAQRPRGEARLCQAPPVVVYRELAPVSIQHYDDFCFCCDGNLAYEDPIEATRVKDTYLYDFGENNAGVCRLKIRGQAGQTVKLRFGEMVVDGYFTLRSTIFVRPGTERYFEYPQMDTYTLKGGEEEIFLPPFTYHGFRYVLVEGITAEQATEDLLTYLVMGSEVQQRAEFRCSDERAERLFAMTGRSDRSNLMYVPTDCPHREKNGWTADIALSAEQMLLYMTAAPSLEEWMRSVRKAQRQDGALPGIIPTAGWGFDWGNGPAWDSVCVYIPYYCYKFDGDTQIIEENKDLILRYLRYARGRLDERGLAAFGLGDWCQPYAVDFTPLAPLEVTDTAVLVDIARKAAHLFRQVGDAAAAAEAQGMADDLRMAFRTHLIDMDTMTVAGSCQTSQTLAVAFDILDEEEKPQAVKRLVEFIHEQQDHLLCGVIGGRQLFHVLTAYGYGDLAYQMIVRPDSPSYGSWLEAGYTTLCESFSTPGKNCDSRNHHFWGHISSLFVQNLVGLQPNPFVRDIREFWVSPVFLQSLSWAEAGYDSVCGKVSVGWQRTGEQIGLRVQMPDGLCGQIQLPQGYAFADGTTEKPLQSGEFTVVAV